MILLTRGAWPHCPRTGRCEGAAASRAREIADVRKEIVSKAKGR
jgi:hypothetical protein